MNLELLASVLEKDAKELAGAFNLAEGSTEVEDEKAIKTIQDHIKEVKVANLSEGKKQAEGMARRLVLTEVENKLKNEFSIDGGSFDEMVSNLKTTLKSGKSSEVDTAKLEAFKSKNADLEAKVKQLEGVIQETEIKTNVKSKISGVIDSFDFVTDKVKSIAVDNFIKSNKFMVSGDDVFIEIDGKPTMKLQEIAEQTFSEFGKKKEVQKDTPAYKPNEFSSFKNKEEVFKALHNSKTAEERASLLEELKKYD